MFEVIRLFDFVKPHPELYRCGSFLVFKGIKKKGKMTNCLYLRIPRCLI